jgi:hypothetical protein
VGWIRRFREGVKGEKQKKRGVFAMTKSDCRKDSHRLPIPAKLRQVGVDVAEPMRLARDRMYEYRWLTRRTCLEHPNAVVPPLPPPPIANRRRSRPWR